MQWSCFGILIKRAFVQECDFRAIAQLLTAEYLWLDYYARKLEEWASRSLGGQAEAERAKLLQTCSRQQCFIQTMFSHDESSHANWITLAQYIKLSRPFRMRHLQKNQSKAQILRRILISMKILRSRACSWQHKLSLQGS